LKKSRGGKKRRSVLKRGRGGRRRKKREDGMKSSVGGKRKRSQGYERSGIWNLSWLQSESDNAKRAMRG
jgi:hypothetical protein